MPYESFATEQLVHITEVVQDTATNAWMYLVHVQRTAACSPTGDEGFTHEYAIHRRFSEFKQLHAALLPVMGSDALTPLPADGLMTLLMADNEELLLTRKEVLEQILRDVLNHPVAKDLPEVLEFLGHESLEAKVLAPLHTSSGQCTGSIRKTSSMNWTALGSPTRGNSAVVSS
ncbi:Bisphosphate nucleotidase, partial [Globisporangium splendens]